MTNVYTVFVKSDVYTSEWVYRMKRSIEKNTTVPFRFFCLTNENLPGIETIPLVNPNGWWAKMELCRPDIKGRVHYLDLDTIITGNIDFFLNETESLLYEDWLYEDQKESAVFVLNEEERKTVWDFWSKDPRFHMFNFFGDGRVYNFTIGKSLGTIQGKHPGKLFTWKKTDKKSLQPGCKILSFSGKPKPNDFSDDHWIKKYW
jgi:hypothetical protein